MRRFFQSLQSKLILLIILVALPGLAGLIFQSVAERKHAMNAILQQGINTVDNTIAHQAQLIKETQSFLLNLSTFKAVQDPQSAECSLLLANILKLNDNYINLGVPEPDGALNCNATPLKKSVNVADRSYFQEVLANRDFSIGKFQTDRATGVSSINFAYPVIDSISDEITGVAVAVISLDWWSKYLLESYLPKNSVAYITDDEQRIIAAYPANTKLLGTKLKEPQGDILKDTRSSDKTSKIIRSFDNHQRIFVSRALFESNNLSNITIQVGIPLDKELAGINSRLVHMGGFLFAFIILMFVIAIWGIQKNVLEPLKLLLQSTKNLELGKKIEAFPQHGASELVDLQQHFSLMAKKRLSTEKELINSQLSLQKSESRLLLHIEHTPLGCISWDTDFNCTEWNKSAEKIFGYRADEAIGKNGIELIVAPELKEKLGIVFSSLLKQVGGRYNVNENITKDGRIIFCEWHNTPMLLNGSVIGITSLVQDVTERKQLEDKLTLAASVFSHAREGIVITDANGIIIDVNDTVLIITGYQRDEMIGQNPSMLKSNRQPPDFYQELWQSLTDKGYWTGEIWNKRKNCEIYPQLLTISVVHDEAGNIKNYVALFADITELKKQQLQLQNMAHYDLLTGLPNRSLLADRLNQAIIQSKRNKHSLAVVFLDLDGFKAINDKYGHKFGDELLVSVSSQMKKALRDGDTLSRFGGDEFVILLADLTKTQDFKAILERLLVAVSEPVIVNETPLQVSASIGLTLYPMDDANGDQLIRHADQAMYVAKQKGKNCYHLFDAAFYDEINTQLKSLQHLGSALVNREFVLYYQPKVNMKTGDVIGVEALIRWQHPERGLVPPLEFLPLIENHELSIDVGEWVIDEALNQIEKWQKQDLNLPISINLGALQLQQQDFAERLAVQLAAHPNVAAQDLQLEVLETSALGDIMDVSKIMNECIKLGVNFALDDFGTGYSSLTYLRRLPVNLIKIDQTFVRDMLIDPEDRMIVTGVVALAKSFNIHVMAEGVETIAHGTTLLELGCDLAQGYGIARPMPAEQVAQWISNWQPNVEWHI
jgi:diguanylate cyclase (GGDEF)-like protein/PAS domain S-box-containing protein